MITILQQPTVYFYVGETLRLTTKVLEKDVKIQWLLNSNPILNATGSDYEKTKLILQDAGRYSAKLSQSGSKGITTKYSTNTYVGVLNLSPTSSIPPSGSTPPTSSLPPTGSSQIGGYINGLSQSFVTGNTYTLDYIPIGWNLDDGHIIWESNVADVFLGNTYTFTPNVGGNFWIQTEADLIDGRRLITDSTINVKESVSNYIELYNPNILTDNTIRNWYKLDTNFLDSKTSTTLTKNGNISIDSSSFIFPNRTPAGCVLINGITDYVSSIIPPLSSSINFLSVECMMRLKSFNPNGTGNSSIIRLEKNWNAYFAFLQDMWSGASIQCYNNTLMTTSQINTSFPTNQWNHIKLLINKSGYFVFINGMQTASASVVNAIDSFLGSNINLTIGQEVGYIDEIIIKYN